jgi:IPT/TIG domain-containing protein
MATLSASGPQHGRAPLPGAKNEANTERRKTLYQRWALFAGVVLLASLAAAQATPQVTAVDPDTGKVNDTVTVAGSNLGKANVSAIYLSDDKNDYRATVVDQGDDKITIKVPQVKPGGYNISIQVGDKLFIKPVKFKVSE